MTKHLALLASLGKLGLSEHMLLWSLVDLRRQGRGSGREERSHKEPHAGRARASTQALQQKNRSRTKAFSLLQAVLLQQLASFMIRGGVLRPHKSREVRRVRSARIAQA